MFVIMVLLVCATCFVVLDLSFCMRLVIGAKTKLTCRFFVSFCRKYYYCGFLYKAL